MADFIKRFYISEKKTVIPPLFPVQYFLLKCGISFFVRPVLFYKKVQTGRYQIGSVKIAAFKCEADFSAPTSLEVLTMAFTHHVNRTFAP